MKITKYHVISSKCAAIVGSKPPSQCGRQLHFAQTLPNRSIQDTAALQLALESLTEHQILPVQTEIQIQMNHQSQTTLITPKSQMQIPQAQNKNN